MGDPKKLRKQYSTPVHPWNKTRIDEEKKLTFEFGLGKKKEIMIANSFLKKYMNIAKRLIARQTPQGEKEKAQVMHKLSELGFLGTGAELDHILGLNVKDILERRLQSIVFRKGLARSMKQARQFIVHRHIMVGEREINVPSYLVTLKEEDKIVFKVKSALADDAHPERVDLSKAENVEMKPAVESPKDAAAKEAPAKEVETPKAEEAENVKEVSE